MTPPGDVCSLCRQLPGDKDTQEGSALNSRVDTKTLGFIPWDAHFSMNTPRCYRALQCQTTTVNKSLSQSQQGETAPLCTFHHSPHKTTHPWIQHPAPPLHLHHGDSTKKENPAKGKTPGTKSGKQKSVGWGWNNPSHSAPTAEQPPRWEQGKRRAHLCEQSGHSSAEFPVEVKRGFSAL